jgi:SAM-dependent methyltransferase
VTADVQDFYERYPYPPPVDSLDAYRRLWEDRHRRRADHHLFWPATPYRDNHSILVAGCGTSQAAKYALRWPAARVTGIDFSTTSVHRSEDLKQKYRLDNLQLHQLPLEQVGELGTDFDQIVCTGVLHHLPDPDAGLRALRAVLTAQGTMHLMVYAPYGRTGVYMLQDFCRRLGIRAIDGDIRDLVAALTALPPGHPLVHLLREAPDFRQEAAVADALLHPQDRAYSVPQLFEFMARIPQSSRIAQLPLPAQYAAAELFRGTMPHHSVVVHRSDRASRPAGIDFSSETWLDYVPIRMPDTICVQERLPAGAAGVLINQTHTDRDLIAPIDAIEKSVFDAIDGTRTIGEIVAQTKPAAGARSETTRTFFERLWWHDQVVFDTSRLSPDR